MLDEVEIFPWNDNFTTGIDIIDQQHQQLVFLINELARHIAYQSDVPTLNKIFDQLKDYAHYHFETEEQIWHDYMEGDDWLKGHEKTHASFLTEVSEIKEHENGESLEEILEEILSFLIHWLAFHILDSDKRMAQVVLAMQAGETLEQAKVTTVGKMDGAMRVLIETILTMYDNLSARTLAFMKEVTERERAQERLRLTSSVIEHSLEAIFITDDQHMVIDCNPAFSAMCNLDHEQILGKNIYKLKPVLADPLLNDSIMEGLLEVGHWAGEVWLERKSGNKEPEWLTYSVIKANDGAILNYVGVFSSMSQLVQRQMTLEQAANYDLLTDLPNRRLLADRLQQSLLRAQRSQKSVAVCFLDLDGFKAVNDSLGHSAGDTLLIETAQRLQREIRTVDTVARLGGDEFVLVLEGLSEVDAITPLLNKLLSVISEPVKVGDNYAQVTASMGVVIGKQGSDTSESLLEKADKAMYQAKQAGKSCYQFFK